MQNELLPEYQKYLHAKSLVQEKYITYYAHWASEKRQVGATPCACLPAGRADSLFSKPA